jgi:hypothetical protein
MISWMYFREKSSFFDNKWIAPCEHCVLAGILFLLASMISWISSNSWYTEYAVPAEFNPFAPVRRAHDLMNSVRNSNDDFMDVFPRKEFIL